MGDPESALGKAVESLRLCFALAHPIVAIATLLWLPLHLVTNGVFGTHWALMSLASFLELVIGSLVTASILCSVSQYRQGSVPGLVESLRGGLDSWGGLVLTNMLAGIVILAGFVALVLPGFYLLFLYALVAPVVVFENTTGRAALTRSGRLTEGRKLNIALAAIPLLVLIMAVGVLYVGLEVAGESLALPPLVWIAVTSLVDLGGSLLSVPITILMALFYWEAEASTLSEEAQLFTSSLQG